MRPLRNTALLTLWLALLLSANAMPLRAQSPTEPMPRADYRAELQRAIDTLEAAPEEEADTVLDELQEQFDAIDQVLLPTGEIVSTRSILEGLAAWETETAEDESGSFTLKDFALIRLRAAVVQIDASANDNTAARLAILADILARPEFNTPMSLWDRFWKWLEELISRWLPDSQMGGNAGWLTFLIRALPWIISIIIVAAIIWLLSYWLQRFLRSFVADAHVLELAGDDDLPRSAAEARQQARIAAQSGLYRDAVRRLYLAAILQLAEHNLITYERSLTNREVLVRVPKDSPIRAHLEPIVATFDQVWYGVHEPDQATFTQYEQEIDALAAVTERASADQAKRSNA